ncbi:BsuBI/PstI family type II restriction endonuclease [Paenibacillus sp. HW567]|uniref:BsuBI/PstI family type II restriction endonuclease n=1 Tax=Paenibacillus sp. HW567 TaxID=1034769 RepID=UPI0003640F2A|nr:BsuBI/PstI family type II restriction endonuclease [Paenibacillus sp. HW567]
MKWYEYILPDVEAIKERLQVLIPENVEEANYARNIVASRTIFVMLYSFAIEGEEGRIRPSTVTIMTDEQAEILSPEERRRWLKQMQSPKKPFLEKRWYSENTRESIRDDTISTLKRLGAVKEQEGIPTTSSKPRYYLSKEFVELLNPELDLAQLTESFLNWQKKNLHKGAIIIQELRELEKRSVIEVIHGNSKTFLAPGKSSVLTKLAVESFAKNFFNKPEVLLISESAEKIHWQFGKLLDRLKLTVNPKKLLPDLIIVETATKEDEDQFLFVFIEIVHTDGPITGERKEELTLLAKNSGIREEYCIFVTVFASRSDSAYRKVQSSLAWGSFAWFADEPERLIHLIDPIGKQLKLSEMI